MNMFGKKKKQQEIDASQIFSLFLGLTKKFGTEYSKVNKDLECTFDTTYVDEKGGETKKSETKNAITWIPKILIDINNSLKQINANLEEIAKK